jgi:hypothetical protein
VQTIVAIVVTEDAAYISTVPHVVRELKKYDESSRFHK